MLNAAVIGLGWWGKQIINCLGDSDRIKVVTAVDVNAQEGATFAASKAIAFTTHYEDVLKDAAVDAVILVTPHALHEEQVLAAAAAGKQIFCEKPFSLTAGSAKRMMAACRAENLIVGIGHERRYEGALVEMKRMMDAGELGALLHLEFNASYNLFMGTPATGWRLDTKQAPAGTMTALGVHQTDYIQTLAGRVKTINARMAHRSTNYPSDDILSIHFEFENGMLGSFTSIATTPFYQRMTVFGDRAWAEIREVANVDKPDPTLLTWRDIEDEIHTRTYKRTDTVRENLHEWAAAVEGDGDYRFTGDHILHNVEILDAIVTSAATGAPVHLTRDS